MTRHTVSDHSAPHHTAAESMAHEEPPREKLAPAAPISHKYLRVHPGWRCEVCGKEEADPARLGVKECPGS